MAVVANFRSFSETKPSWLKTGSVNFRMAILSRIEMIPSNSLRSFGRSITVKIAHPSARLWSETHFPPSRKILGPKEFVQPLFELRNTSVVPSAKGHTVIMIRILNIVD